MIPLNRLLTITAVAINPLTSSCGPHVGSEATLKAESSPCQVINHIVGIEGKVKFATTDLKKAKFGVKLRYFLGDWDGKDDFTNRTLVVVPRTAEIIESHSARCFTDSTVGRVTPSFYSVDHNDPQALTKLFDRILAVKREILLTQNALVDDLTPSLQSKLDELKAHLSQALLNFYQMSSNRTQWAIELMSRIIDVANAKKDTLVLTRVLISDILINNPDIKDEIIRRLKSDTETLLSQYRAFAGKESIDRLNEHLSRVGELVEETDIDAIKTELTNWADTMENVIKDIFADNQPLHQTATKLNFIYGSTVESPAHVEQFYGRSSASSYLEEVGQDADLWEGL